jgi:N-ethylmaleimide reductase
MPVSLFTPYTMGSLSLKNRAVMSPMTRSRAVGNVPNALMATYYAQRADVGLIVTEGTSPSPNGLGYSSIPGAYSDEQRAGWKLIADAVHAENGRVFVQLMHTGRISHQSNLPTGAEVVAPSAIAAAGTIFTPQGMQPHTTPRALRLDELPAVVAEYVHAAQNLIAAGIDGIELHAANGYLLEQFLHPASNHRTDAYGGSVEHRQRFVVEVAEAVVKAIGGDKVGIRLSPHGTNGDLATYDGVDDATVSLVKKLDAAGVGYVHLLDHSAMGGGAVPASLKAAVRAAWPRTLILAGGYDKASATADLVEGKGDLIGFGRPVIANPGFVARLEQGRELNAVDFATLYSPGEKGYTDYPL